MKSDEIHPGRALMVGIPGPDLDPATRGFLAEVRPAGVILFGRNLDSPSRVTALIADVRRAVPAPVLLALDQEGGAVSRLEPWVGPTPSAAALARRGPGAALEFGRATGAALRGLGFDVDFAPVVDLDPPATRNGIGDRSFGTDPNGVVQLAGAVLDGIQGAGVAGCLKHFPGLGGTAVDSHFELPVVDRSRAQLQVDLAPYRRLGPRAASVMVGHGSYPALDATRVPATCSAPIVTGLLRGELAYGGLVVSDDLEMGAVAERDIDGTVAAEAIAAGCDLLLYCADADRARRALAAMERAAVADPDFRARLTEAIRRVEDFAADWSADTSDDAAWTTACDALRTFA